MKKCCICTVPKSLDEFNKNKARKDGVQSCCRICQRELDRKFQQKRDLSKKYKTAHNRKMRVRDQVLVYLKDHPCIDCGESDPVVLEFDHRGDKEMAISEMTRRGTNLERLFKEIDKCDVRCANCHRRKTAKQFGWNKIKE